MTAPSGPRGGSQAALREANEALLLEALRAGPATQADLVRSTGLSGATVSTIARDLLGAGVLRQAEGGGRGQALCLSPRAGLTAGVSFGSGRALVALGDLTDGVLGVREAALGADAAGSVASALSVLDDLLGEQGLDRSVLLSVGVGLPVPVSASGRATEGHWADADVAALIGPGLPCPVLVDNDANLGVRAEARWGALRGRTVGAFVLASRGIGVGLLLDGRVHRGAKGTAGELGHVSTDPDGPLCPCGGRGCLERSTAGPALLAEYAQCTGRTTTLRGLVQAALDGDTAAVRLVDDAGDRLGAALAGLVTLLDPELVVLGGDLAGAGDLLLDPLALALRRRAMPAVAAGVAVTTSALGERAVVLGALALALESAAPRGSAR